MKNFKNTSSHFLVQPRIIKITFSFIVFLILRFGSKTIYYFLKFWTLCCSFNFILFLTISFLNITFFRFYFGHFLLILKCKYNGEFILDIVKKNYLKCQFNIEGKPI